jgi:Zn-dependent peptidase ImmA (M78 family)
MPLMDDRRIGYCRELARTVVRRSGIRRPPVDVRAIAEGAGLEILDANLGAVDGRLRRTQHQWIIEVNPDRSMTNQRFTIAHEFGHLKMGHQSCGPEDVQERQANLFAAELLMPLPMLKEALKTTRRLSDLARLFVVSPEAMRIKLDEQRLLLRLERLD